MQVPDSNVWGALLVVEYGLFCSSTCFRPSPYTPNYPVYAGQVVVNIGLKCAQSPGISKNAIVLSYTQINERLIALKNNSTEYQKSVHIKIN